MTAAKMLFSCKVINSLKEFSLLRGQWNRLVKQSTSCTFFMSWEWLDTWLSIYSDIVEQLIILLVFDKNNKLAGAMPLYLATSLNASLNGRQLRFIGNGEEEWEEVATEYHDVLSRYEVESEVCDLLFKTLCGLGLNWNLLVVENVLNDSVLMRKFIPLFLEDKYPLIKSRSGQRYRIDLPQSWTEYEARLGKSMKRKIRQSKNKINKMEGVITETIKNTELGFSELKAIHEERWQKKNIQGAFSSPKFQEFHRELMSRLLKDGNLRIRRTSIGSKVIAILYNIRFSDTESYYQSGFDLQLGSRVRPGIYAHMRAIEASIKEKVQYYDMMKGGDDSYKSEYGAEVAPMLSIRLYNRTLGGKSRYLRELSLRYIRKLRDQYT
ncbi:MAG: hypothetical protein DSZ28_02360 [Thiothrix sp.]|nr:MAG: hypothetical protein DSZ28_02360 [Thiothrix sp.]